MHTADIIVIGGGVIGASVSYGLARRGCSVALVDQGDARYRASVGNFGLVWVQGKGAGNRPYTQWTLDASERYRDFVARLGEETGVDLQYSCTGGISLVFSPEEFETRSQLIGQLRAEAGSSGYPCEMLDREGIQALIPKLPLGPAIVGGSYSSRDGHLNPLLLLHSLYKGYYRAGGRHFPGQTAIEIAREGDSFTVQTDRALFSASKIVLTAGLGIADLASRIGLSVPVRPQRGQLLVSERVRPMLDLPLSRIRQTGEGSFLIGLSNEEVGFDLHTTLTVQRSMARFALAAFPSLGGLRIVRSWAALRVLTPDMMPVYQESEDFPGAYVVTSHSGVTLAPLHAYHIVNWIVDGYRPDRMAEFDLRRFDVQETT